MAKKKRMKKKAKLARKELKRDHKKMTMKRAIKIAGGKRISQIMPEVQKPPEYIDRMMRDKRVVEKYNEWLKTAGGEIPSGSERQLFDYFIRVVLKLYENPSRATGDASPDEPERFVPPKKVNRELLALMKRFSYLLNDVARGRWFADGVESGRLSQVPSRGEIEDHYTWLIDTFLYDPYAYFEKQRERLDAGFSRWVPQDHHLQHPDEVGPIPPNKPID